MKAALKYIAGAIGTVLVGNVFWDYFAKAFLSSCFNKAAVLLNSITGSYLDLLHSRIGEARTPDGLYVFSGLAMICLSVSGILFIIAFPEQMFTRTAPRSAKRAITALIVTILVAIGLTVAEKNYRVLYQSRAIVWVDQTIEIIRPQISEAEYIQLRSDFRSVDTAQKFYALNTSIVHLAEEKKISLPQFKPIGN